MDDFKKGDMVCLNAHYREQFPHSRGRENQVYHIRSVSKKGLVRLERTARKSGKTYTELIHPSFLEIAPDTKPVLKTKGVQVYKITILKGTWTMMAAKDVAVKVRSLVDIGAYAMEVHFNGGVYDVTVLEQSWSKMKSREVDERISVLLGLRAYGFHVDYDGKVEVPA